jgi:alkylation response protein AidB-like acyl-CoA dehydrogenase
VRVELTDEQEFLREAVAGAVARDAAFTAVRRWAESQDFTEPDTLAERQGWTGIGLDEERGGQGGGTIELAVLAEQLGRGAVPWDRTLAGCLAAGLLAASENYGARELAAAVAEGERRAVLVVDGTRPLAACGGNSNGNGASEDEGEAAGTLAADTAELSLSVPYVLGAAGADELVVPVVSGDEVALFALAVDAAGVSVRPRTLVDRTRSLADVALDGATLRSLGTVSRAALAATASTAAILVAADALGAAGRLLDLTTQYVGERRQFGVPVGSFQAVKHAAAEMLVDVEGARSAVQHGAWAVGAGAEDARLHASVAKSHACAAAVRVADKALFLHGAVGYTWEHDLQFTFKRAKSDALVLGSPDAYRDLIADDLGLA